MTLPKDNATINALVKGLQVIKTFDAKHSKMTLSEVASRTHITRASSRRILLTLETLGYVEQIGNVFCLTPKVLDLGYSYFASLPWTDIAYKHIKGVVQKCTLSCSISILDDTNIVCIARVPSTRILNEVIHVGTRLPAAYTATGRIFMAHMRDDELAEYIKTLPLQKYTSSSITTRKLLLDTIKKSRSQMYQLVADELEVGFASLAVAIYNRENEILGTINVGTYLSYKNTDFLLQVVLPLLQEAADKTTEAIRKLQY